MTNMHGYNDDEWEVLLYVPFVVFFAVAYADGKLSPAESNAFGMIAKNVATQAARPQDALVRDVMAAVSADIGGVGRRLDARVGAGMTFDAILATGVTLLERADSTSATVFKNTMIAMAESIAEAWPIFGRKTSAEEQESINQIRRVLGLAGPSDAFVPFGND